MNVAWLLLYGEFLSLIHFWVNSYDNWSQLSGQSTSFCFGEVPCRLQPYMDCLFSCFVGGEKTCVYSSLRADQLQDQESFFSALWAFICFQLCWQHLMFSASPSPSSCFCSTLGMVSIMASIPSLCLQCHWLLVLLPLLSKEREHPLGLNLPTLDFPTGAPGKKLTVGNKVTDF